MWFNDLRLPRKSSAMSNNLHISFVSCLRRPRPIDWKIRTRPFDGDAKMMLCKRFTLMPVEYVAHLIGRDDYRVLASFFYFSRFHLISPISLICDALIQPPSKLGLPTFLSYYLSLRALYHFGATHYYVARDFLIAGV